MPNFSKFENLFKEWGELEYILRSMKSIVQNEVELPKHQIEAWEGAVESFADLFIDIAQRTMDALEDDNNSTDSQLPVLKIATKACSPDTTPPKVPTHEEYLANRGYYDSI